MASANVHEILTNLINIINNKSAVTQELNQHSKNIRLNMNINEDPNKAPWMGVFLTRSTIEPNTTARGWLQVIEAVIVTQSSDLRDSNRCMEKLEILNKGVCDAIMEDTTKLNGTVDNIRSLDISYTNAERGKDNVFFQASLIDVTVEVRVNGR